VVTVWVSVRPGREATSFLSVQKPGFEYAVVHSMQVLSWELALDFAAKVDEHLGSGSEDFVEVEAKPLELIESLKEIEGDFSEYMDLIAQGEKLGAIRLYRERTGADLATAKEVIEAIDPAGTPGNAKLSDSLWSAGCAVVLFTILALAIYGAYALFSR
jgi:ribosomal protein L7/L12